MEETKRFLTTFMTAISTCSLYSRAHASVEELARKAHEILTGLIKERLELMVLEGELVVNRNPVRGLGLHGANLMKRFKRKGLSRVDFLKGITFIELKQFIADMADPDRPVMTYPHIKTGAVDVRVGGIMTGVEIDVDSVASEQIEGVKRLYRGISSFKPLDTRGLEEIVLNFIVSFKKEASILKLISPVSAYSEYTYTHATNVAVLSMFQAETLGFRDELLHDIGVAALLHDVGKLFIPREILEKKGSLDEEEWNEIKMHTLHGARYLAKIDGLTPLAPVVALEHHLRYDGEGYPELGSHNGRQHFCSQIVAISDFFDALRSKRPYKRDWQIEEIIALMKNSAGREFNPVLVDNFSRAFTLALKQG